ncbi:MAG TPA: hypothetical protein VHX68_21225, partial [Planctomycetaceae bacterium]|nr:hypothetical protein [Planctomycetaceae bacterium]
MSSRRVWGGVLILLSVLLNASLMWIVAGPGMSKVVPTDILFTPFPYIGLLVIGFGLVLIFERSLDRVLEWLVVLLVILVGTYLFAVFSNPAPPPQIR